MSQISIKQGATLQLLVAAQNDDQTPFDLSATTYSAQLRTNANRLIDTLVLTPTGIPGQLSVSQPTDTWPVGLLFCDFKFVSTTNNVVLKTQTFTFQVLAAITL